MTGDNPLRVASRLAQEGKTAEAIECLESALARTRSDPVRPANTSLLAKTAGLHSEAAGRLSLAAAYYEEASATADPDAVLLIALADVRWKLRQAESARSCLERAEAIAQSTADADALQMVAIARARWAHS